MEKKKKKQTCPKCLESQKDIKTPTSSPAEDACEIWFFCPLGLFSRHFILPWK